MKKTLLLFSAVVASLMSSASDVKLVVEKLDNGGVVAGTTYRVYAQISNPEHSLHIVYGDQANPLKIQSTAPFFQHAYAGYCAANLNQAVVAADKTAMYDSWITLGYADNQNNDMWDLGVDFNSFGDGGAINANNGGWFLLPTDEKCAPDNNGLVLIGQFTSTGVVSGTLNLQGLSAPHVAWKEVGLTFTTDNAMVFGCTDNKASNYNPAASFDNGSCAFSNQHNTTSNPMGLVGETSVWDVFPNPLRDNMLNIQFKNLDVKQTATRIDIMDMTGKLVGSHSISADAVMSGNRVTIQQELAAGTYKAILIQAGLQESKTIVVQK